MDVQVNTAAAKLIEQNRSALKPLISTVLLYGRQEIPFRGSEETGPIPLIELEVNDGNFRAFSRPGRRQRLSETSTKLSKKSNVDFAYNSKRDNAALFLHSISV